MERFVAWVLGSSLFGISTLGMLGFVWGGAKTPPMPAKPEGDWRLLEPIRYENMTIFPVVSAMAADTSAFVTLDEGLASGEVIVREEGSGGLERRRGGRVVPDYSGGASVNQLVLINRGKRPVLLLAGELVSGGKQDRIIGKDRIVPAGAEPLPLDVFCVEHGRWSSGADFSAAKTIVHPSVREQAAVEQDQGRVWSAVRSGTTAVAAPAAPAPSLPRDAIAGTIREDAPTESYAHIYDSKRVSGSVDNLVEELQRRFAKETSGLKEEHVVGAVVAYGDEVAWSDIFASGELFRAYWPKLLRSYAVEALARPRYQETASRDDASEFLLSLKGMIREETDPGVYIWREIKEGRLSEIELDALRPKEMMLHRLLLRRTS
ncbi:MAG TPA: DUF6569 family protein [Terriglobales bacterium]|nr:DUF6569 family protein [Terriglobales bacterium]